MSRACCASWGSISQRSGPAASAAAGAREGAAWPLQPPSTAQQQSRCRAPAALRRCAAAGRQAGGLMNAALPDRLRSLDDDPERLLVAFKVRGQGANDPFHMAGAGDDARGDDALRRQQVDEVEDELFPGVGDAEQVGIAALQLLVADLDGEAVGGLGHAVPPWGAVQWRSYTLRRRRRLEAGRADQRGRPSGAGPQPPPPVNSQRWSGK